MTPSAIDDAVTPFRVTVPQADLDDLKQRLARTRWPERETVTDWSQGVPLAKAQALIAYWRNLYDWRRFEARLNAFPQFQTRIDDLDIHFLHVRSSHRNALPIILTHGWPGSIVEFLDLIEPLTEPTRFGGRAEDAFHVVIPCLPGFGFSGKPAETGWDVVRTAKAWAALMERLGYTNWLAQGGDWGSGVTHVLALLRPEGLAAAHVNLPLVFPAELPANPMAEEAAAFAGAAHFGGEESGFYRQQSTRPQTIGYALADSPAGQALWIYEKFQAWADHDGAVEDVLGLDRILDAITLYWLTNSAASSARFYWENGRNPASPFSAGRIELPMAATTFPKEIFQAPRAWAEAAWRNLLYWGKGAKGGHFAAFEQPAIFAAELREAFRSLRAG